MATAGPSNRYDPSGANQAPFQLGNTSARFATWRITSICMRQVRVSLQPGTVQTAALKHQRETFDLKVPEYKDDVQDKSARSWHGQYAGWIETYTDNTYRNAWEQE